MKVQTQSRLFLCVAAIFLIAVTASSGCAQKPSASSGVGDVFIGGTDGIVTTFMPGSPPDELMENEKGQTISLQIENKGEYGVNDEDVVVCLSGPNEFNVDPLGGRSITESFLSSSEKVGQSIIPGGTAALDYEFDTPRVPGDQQLTLSAVTLYNYSTKATATVCIAQSLLSQTTGTNLCEPNGPKPVESSGGPIQITAVDEIASASSKGVNAMFKITVSNSGAGTVYHKDAAFKDCTLANPFKHINKVVVTAQLGSDDLKCTPAIATLIDNEQTVTCKTDGAIALSNSYEELLRITAQYKYAVLGTKKVTLRNIPGSEEETISFGVTNWCCAATKKWIDTTTIDTTTKTTTACTSQAETVCLPNSCTKQCNAKGYAKGTYGDAVAVTAGTARCGCDAIMDCKTYCVKKGYEQGIATTPATIPATCACS